MSHPPRILRGEGWWAVTGSNRRPSGCKPLALPTELTARRDTDPYGVAMRDAASGAPRAPSFHDTARKRKTPAFEECRRLREASGKSVDRVLQPLARLELRLLGGRDLDLRSEEQTSELQSLMRIS